MAILGKALQKIITDNVKCVDAEESQLESGQFSR